MAVLQKMRGWGIVLSILVALPLLLFIIDPQQIMQTVQSVSSKNDVGKIAGKAISYMDFQQDVDKFQTINEILTGNSTSEEGQKQARDAAWQNLVDKFATYDVISKQLGVERTTVWRNIKKLQDIGRLRREGGDKDGYWKTIE